MSLELEMLRDLSTRLEDAGVKFMLTGSMAMNAYAEPRMTRDVDLVVELAQNDAARIVALLTPGYYVDLAVVERAIAGESMFNAIHLSFVLKADFIVRKNSVYRALEFSRRRRVRFAECDLWIVSKEDLILSKLCWGRDSRSEYQGRDIRNLLATGCDRAYLLRWSAELGVLDYLAELEK